MDPELEAEQAHVDLAYEYLDWMRARARELLHNTDREELDLQHVLKRRIASLTDGGRPLCFGRIDVEEGPTFHIGRRHVEDKLGDPVVVEWRAPVAVPFYRANPVDPMGLTRRRQFIVDGRQIQSMADDMFGPPDPNAQTHRIRGGDALLAELERGRGAEMLDIVATIQAEQDEVIRSPLAGVLVVQGGPGSGKTAVGLHRAAFLLYGDDALARQGVLVLGPNRVFLRYIAQVLPSLGEEAVVQTTVRDLAPGIRVVADDHPAAERVKGDARMAAVIAQALATGRRPLDNDIAVPVGLRTLTLPAAEANGTAEEIASRRLAYETGRAVLRDTLIAAIVALHPAAGTDEHTEIARQVRNATPLTAAVDRLWPTANAAGLVRTLVTSRAALTRAARGLLDPAEQADVLRKPTPTEPLEIRSAALPPPAWELRQAARKPKAKPKLRDPWTAADVALYDEATALITSEGRTYGHIVIDEAQDLSPMQLRMIARRSPAGSVTLLGDLAQASGAWAAEDWSEVLIHLATPDGWRRSELRLGYRSPADVIELGARILRVAAPNVPPTEAVRGRKGSVRMVDASASGNMAAAVADAVLSHTESHRSLAVIAVADALDALEEALRAAGVDAGRADAGGLERPVALVEARTAKGLEFDAVVVADPAAIVASAADEMRGLRLLYVAVTRPTQALTIVHAGDLPSALLP